MNSLLNMEVVNYSMIAVWIVITVVAVIVEFETANLVSIWFAAGSVASLIASAFGQPVWVQIVLFVAISALFIVLTRPFVNRITKNQTILTNADKYIGMKVLVTKDITPNSRGEVKVEYKNWPAISSSSFVFTKGQYVIVSDIVGNKMLVKEIEEIDIK